MKTTLLDIYIIRLYYMILKYTVWACI